MTYVATFNGKPIRVGDEEPAKRYALSRVRARVGERSSVIWSAAGKLSHVKQGRPVWTGWEVVEVRDA